LRARIGQTGFAKVFLQKASRRIVQSGLGFVELIFGFSALYFAADNPPGAEFS
jgi:hypothetical protein